MSASGGAIAALHHSPRLRIHRSTTSHEIVKSSIRQQNADANQRCTRLRAPKSEGFVPLLEPHIDLTEEIGHGHRCQFCCSGSCDLSPAILDRLPLRCYSMKDSTPMEPQFTLQKQFVELRGFLQRLYYALGPLAAGIILDVLDLATFGPIGIFVGAFVGGYAGWILGEFEGFDHSIRIAFAICAAARVDSAFTYRYCFSMRSRPMRLSRTSSSSVL